MKNIIYLTLGLLALSCNDGKENVIPIDFEDKVFEHIVKLSGFGIRSAETDAEKNTIEYLQSEFESLDLKVTVDTFHYKGFSINKKAIEIGDSIIDYEKIIFNPYQGLNKIIGKGYFYHPDSSMEKLPELNKKVVITKKPANIWGISDKNPEAIIILNEANFDKCLNLNNAEIIVNTEGTVKTYTSYNIHASTNLKKEKEIIISAHWDSHCGPGANDNASGIGVMIEIARFFSQNIKDLPYNLRFVAFGAEEMGMIGSKAFVTKHQNELKQCLYNFNIDNVGGMAGPYLALKGVESYEGEKDYMTDLVARTNVNENWMGLGHHFHMNTPTITPDWLIKTIEKAADSCQIEITAIGQMGSDHRIFANKGVPSTNMCIVDTVETRYHSSDDLPNYIEKSSLRKAGLLVINAINLTELSINAR